jgi:hypothetical protein
MTSRFCADDCSGGQPCVVLLTNRISSREAKGDNGEEGPLSESLFLAQNEDFVPIIKCDGQRYLVKEADSWSGLLLSVAQRKKGDLHKMT